MDQGIKNMNKKANGTFYYLNNTAMGNQRDTTNSNVMYIPTLISGNKS